MASYEISVVLPVHIISSSFNQIREAIFQATQKIEIIYVVDERIADDIFLKRDNETIVVKKNTGRGHMLQNGVSIAKGKIIIFLHVDTILPPKWDEKIIESMQDPVIIGGAFNLSFDQPNLYLILLEKFVTCLYYKTGILSGDRAMFVRTASIQQDIHVLNTPIFEDAELSRWMKNQGKVVLLKESVITGADAFRHHGMVRHTLRILMCSLRYEVGDDLDKIFRYYYR